MVHVVLAAGNGLNSSAFAGFDLSALRALREVRSGRRGRALQAVHVRRTAAPSLAGAARGRRGIPQRGRAAAAHSKGPSFSRPHINSCGRAANRTPGPDCGGADAGTSDRGGVRGRCRGHAASLRGGRAARVAPRGPRPPRRGGRGEHDGRGGGGRAGPAAAGGDSPPAPGPPPAAPALHFPFPALIGAQRWFGRSRTLTPALLQALRTAPAGALCLHAARAFVDDYFAAHVPRFAAAAEYVNGIRAAQAERALLSVRRDYASFTRVSAVMFDDFEH